MRLHLGAAGLGMVLLAGCAGAAAQSAAPTDGPAIDASGAASAGAAPVRGDVQQPQMLMAGTTCKRGDASITACVYYESDIARFTAPGPSATSGATLTSFAQYEDHGEIYDNHGPASPIGTGQPVWASYQSKGAGVQAWVKYQVQEDPYRTEDILGWEAEMPYSGTNGGHCIASEFLFCDMTLPGSKDYSADYRVRFWNRPLAVEIHNNVTGLVLTKQGPVTTAGLLVDPAATNQAADNAVLTADGAAGGNGRAYYGGYRSGNGDATFTTEYEVTASATAADVGTTLNIQATVNRDDPTRASPSTGCAVSAPSPSTRVQCKVLVAGSNAGQSRVIVEISKN